MSLIIRRVSQVTVCAALALALAAVPAQANLTPVNTTVAGGSSDAVFTTTIAGNPVTLRCPRTTYTGRTDASGASLSGNFFFTLRSGGSTCVESFLRGTLTLTSRGSVTIAVTSSTAGTSASGSFALDRGFTVTFHAGWGCDFSFAGPATGTMTFEQSTQVMTLTVRGIAVTLSGGGICTGTPTGTFSGTFAMAPRITVS